MDAHFPGIKRPAVLIADDTGIHQILAAVLHEDERILLEARTGPEAWELIQRVHPRVVVLDVRTPPVTSVELATRIKTTPHLANIQVIVLSPDPPTREEHALAEGGVGLYLTMPVSARRVKEVVERALNASRARPSCTSIRPDLAVGRW